MSPQEYFEQSVRLKDLILSNQEELHELRELSDCVSGIDYSKDNVQTSVQSDAGYTKIINKIIDLENMLKDNIESMLLMKCKILSAIISLSDTDQRLIMTKLYVNCMPIEEAAHEMNISVRTAYRLKTEAFQEIGRDWQ